MKAIIMAGGEGSRLRPLTCTMPKPMARIMHKPVMEHIIELLRQHGITEIGVTLQYMPDSIRAYFGDGSAFGVSLTYFCEDTPMGTAGSVKNAGDFLDDDFLVISGDALCDFDLTALCDFHHTRGAEATIALKAMEIPLEYGVVVTDSEGRVQRFLEKPVWSQVFSDTVNTGIYVLNPRVLEITSAMPCDFSGDIFPKLLADSRPLYGFVADGYWCDIGDLDAYRHCHYDIFDGKLAFHFAVPELATGVYADRSAVIEPGAVIHAPAFIGKNACIKSGALIDSYTVVGEGTVVHPQSTVKRSILYRNVVVGKNTQIRGAVICDKAVVHDGAALFEQSVVGEGTAVGRDSVVKPGVKIWPCKVVGDGAIVSSNLVWGTARAANIFGEKGIAGPFNIDIHPSFAQKIGAAFGTLSKSGKVGVGCDGSPAAVMLKYALTAGLLSAGAQVFDFGDQPLPITRSGIKVYGLGGGIHAAVHGGIGYIDVLDDGGANVGQSTEKKLENLFVREEFARTEAVGAVTDLYEYKLYYLRRIINSTASKSMQMRVLVATASSWGKNLLSAAAKDLNSEMHITEADITGSDTAQLQQFAEAVVSGGYQFGAILDAACESIILVDERGRIISTDLYKSLVSLFVMRSYEKARIAVNVSAPGVIDRMAEQYGATVTRTKESPMELMAGLSGAENDLEAQFVLYFDGVGAIIRIMDFLHTHNCSLSSLIDEIPSFYMLRREVDCAFGDKGRVIRTLTEEAEKEKTETLDGVKIKDSHGWVLILPDRTRPLCNVIAQGDTEEYAAELTAQYDAKIRELTQKEKA